MPHYAAFHLGLQCKHMFWGRFEYHQNVLVKKMRKLFFNRSREMVYSILSISCSCVPYIIQQYKDVYGNLIHFQVHIRFKMGEIHCLIKRPVFSDLQPKFKNKCVSGNTLKILGRLGTHIFFSGKKYNFIHFERHFAFQNA